MTSKRSVDGEQHVAAVVEHDPHARVGEHPVVDVGEDAVGHRQHLGGDLGDDDLATPGAARPPTPCRPEPKPMCSTRRGSRVEEQRQVALQPLDRAQLRRGPGDVDAVELERAPDAAGVRRSDAPPPSPRRSPRSVSTVPSATARGAAQHRAPRRQHGRTAAATSCGARDATRGRAGRAPSATASGRGGGAEQQQCVLAAEQRHQQSGPAIVPTIPPTVLAAPTAPVRAARRRVARVRRDGEREARTERQRRRQQHAAPPPSASVSLQPGEPDRSGRWPPASRARRRGRRTPGPAAPTATAERRLADRQRAARCAVTRRAQRAAPSAMPSEVDREDHREGVHPRAEVEQQDARPHQLAGERDEAEQRRVEQPGARGRSGRRDARRRRSPRGTERSAEPRDRRDQSARAAPPPTASPARRARAARRSAASTTPATAPSVLAAYRRPTRRAARALAPRPRSTSSGSVAPIATVGTRQEQPRQQRTARRAAAPSRRAAPAPRCAATRARTRERRSGGESDQRRERLGERRTDAGGARMRGASRATRALPSAIPPMYAATTTIVAHSELPTTRPSARTHTTS